MIGKRSAFDHCRNLPSGVIPESLEQDVTPVWRVMTRRR
jgi:hypothetical protein